MSQVMKGFLGIFLVLFMAVTGIGILGAFLQVMDAQDFHTQIIDELENSDFAASVLREQLQRAAESGYELKVTLYQNEETSLMYEDPEMVPDTLSGIELAGVELRFLLQIGFFQMADWHTINGYAR